MTELRWNPEICAACETVDCLEKCRYVSIVKVRRYPHSSG